MQDIQHARTAAGHILSAVGRAFFKVAGFFLLFGVIGAAIVEGVSFFSSSSHTFGGTLTTVAAIAFGIVAGYAAGLTTAVVEAIRALIDVGKDTVKEVETAGKDAMGEAGKVVGGIEGAVEHKK
jgi:hypothetical protein